MKWIEKKVDIKTRENQFAYKANLITFSQSFFCFFRKVVYPFLCNETVDSVDSQIPWKAWLQRRIRSLKQSASHVSRTWENGNTTDTFSKTICFVNMFLRRIKRSKERIEKGCRCLFGLCYCFFRFLSEKIWGKRCFFGWSCCLSSFAPVKRKRSFQ